MTPEPSFTEGVCVISTPTQWLTDLTPVVIEYEGQTEMQCRALLTVPAGSSDFAREHPPVRLEAPPTEAPLCEASAGGFAVRVWGTDAAAFVCSTMASPSPGPS